MPRRLAEAAMEQRRKDKRRPANCNRRVRPNGDATDCVRRNRLPLPLPAGVATHIGSAHASEQEPT